MPNQLKSSQINMPDLLSQDAGNNTSLGSDGRLYSKQEYAIPVPQIQLQKRSIDICFRHVAGDWVNMKPKLFLFRKKRKQHKKSLVTGSRVYVGQRWVHPTHRNSTYGQAFDHARNPMPDRDTEWDIMPTIQPFEKIRLFNIFDSYFSVMGQGGTYTPLSSGQRIAEVKSSQGSGRRRIPPSIQQNIYEVDISTGALIPRGNLNGNLPNSVVSAGKDYLIANIAPFGHKSNRVRECFYFCVAIENPDWDGVDKKTQYIFGSPSQVIVASPKFLLGTFGGEILVNFSNLQFGGVY